MAAILKIKKLQLKNFFKNCHFAEIIEAIAMKFRSAT